MKKNIIPDINLQNEIQKNKILNSRDFYKGKSFRFLHEWHDGTTYFNDDFYTDFVVYQNVLLACSNTHTSNSSNVPVIIYKGLQPIGVENSEFWSFVFSGIVNPDASFKVQFSSSVESLPNASEHIGEIFVVGPVGNSGNAYEEYIAIHTPSYNEEYTWELIGGGNTSIDLSNYYTKEEINDRYQPRGHYLTRIPEEYVTETELNEALAGLSGSNVPYVVIDYAGGVGQVIAGDLNNVLNTAKNKESFLAYFYNTSSNLGSYYTLYPFTAVQVTDFGASLSFHYEESSTQHKTVTISCSFNSSTNDYKIENVSTNTHNYLTSIPSEYVTESELEIRLEKIDIPTTDLTGYATEQWVENKGYLTKVPDGVITTENVNQITLDGGEIEFK